VTNHESALPAVLLFAFSRFLRNEPIQEIKETPKYQFTTRNTATRSCSWKN